MSYFTPAEFQCKCGECPNKPVNAMLLWRLNNLRASYGHPVYISSAWRCAAQNARVGGVPDSAHTTGLAADLVCTASHARYLMMFSTLGLFNRIGIGDTFIHVDIDDTKPREVFWLYS